MPVIWNPTLRPIVNTMAGTKIVLQPGEKKRVPAVKDVTGTVIDPIVVARKFGMDNRRVGLVVLSDEQAEVITTAKAAELKEQAESRLVEFCQENIRAINQINTEQVMNGRGPVPIPESTKDLLMLLLRITGARSPDEIGASFLSMQQLRDMREHPEVDARFSAIGEAIHQGSVEAGAKELERRRTAEGFVHAPSESSIDRKPRRRGRRSAATQPEG